MREDVIEAIVVMAKCRNSYRSYGIRTEKRKNNTWYCTWAFPIDEKSAKNEGYGNTMISGRVEFDPGYPGCPYCGGSGWVSCGHCNKLTCFGGNFSGEDIAFKCAWCGHSGKAEAAEEFDLRGGGY